MDKIDARKLSRDALKALRGQAMRMRQELGLPWREIARVMVLNTTTAFGWAQRYAAQAEAWLCCTTQKRNELTPTPDAAMPWRPRAPLLGARVA